MKLLFMASKFRNKFPRMQLHFGRLDNLGCILSPGFGAILAVVVGFPFSSGSFFFFVFKSQPFMHFSSQPSTSFCHLTLSSSFVQEARAESRE